MKVPFETQINNYYCGPAAATMIVRGLGFKKTQTQMAQLLKCFFIKNRYYKCNKLWECCYVEYS
ncbi:MAG: C39 family peptidase [Breznakia sp.]